MIIDTSEKFKKNKEIILNKVTQLMRQMTKRDNFSANFFPNKQEKLFLYEEYFDLFAKLHSRSLLPNKILLTGQFGLGKSTFAYHLINYILSARENFAYDIKNCRINSQNKSF